jgi:FMN reductase
MSRIVAILGSVTPPGRLSAAISRAVDRAASAGHDVELFDLADLRLGFVGRPADDPANADAARVVEAITAAEAVLFATPVYRASFTGALKNLLDALPAESLMAKPCGIVAMGATPHHFLGVDRHLRDVLSWFGALTAPVSVYLTNTDFTTGELSEAAAKSLDELVATLALLASAIGGRPMGPAPFAVLAQQPRPKSGS